MITQIYNQDSYVIVNSVNSTPYVNPNAPSSGMLRYHNNQLQVYDGSSWLLVGSSANVGLSAKATEAIEWVQRKMTEEAEARAMSEQYPAVADALGAVREAEQQLKTIVALCRT